MGTNEHLHFGAFPRLHYQLDQTRNNYLDFARISTMAMESQPKMIMPCLFKHEILIADPSLIVLPIVIWQLEDNLFIRTALE